MTQRLTNFRPVKTKDADFNRAQAEIANAINSIVARLNESAHGALAVDATSGFPTMPTCNGVPRGRPAPAAGEAPYVLNSATGALYVYNAGAWVAI